MKKIVMLSMLALSLFISAQSIEKKCKTCGKPIAKCTHKGEHPNRSSVTTLSNESQPLSFNKVLCPDNKHPHIIDLGMPSGTKWACCNVGANLPEEYGDYYAWGEISTKEKYTSENYKWYDITKKDKSGYYHPLTKYNSDGDYGYVDYKFKLDAADDVATVKWGKGWRMPTYEEWNELRKKCSWKWVVLDDVCGYRVVSSVNNNSIFLPAAGVGGHHDQKGHYWASTINYADCAQSVDFDEGAKRLDYYPGTRTDGYSVRPIKTKE
jgi:hypothetical protein